MKKIDINDAYDIIKDSMMYAVEQYGPVTDPSNYQWALGYDIVKAFDEMYSTEFPKDVARTLLGIDIRIHMSDPDIIQLHRIISTCHLHDIDA